MSSGPRFAIYFVPATETALYRFGAAVLGYDCYTGEAVARPAGLGLTEAEWERLTAEPRTYGFHATLKAPFRLRAGLGQAELIRAVQALAASPPGTPVIEPVVGLIEGFVAVVPNSQSSALDRLAADCVTALDRFRAPLMPDERSKRLAMGLSERQIANLDQFGYPYVLEDFRFHMTLTGRVASEPRNAVHLLLQDAFARLVGYGPVPIDRIAVLRQDDTAARFRVIANAPLGCSPHGAPV
jgi:putative phosphonate metabolism protein